MNYQQDTNILNDRSHEEKNYCETIIRNKAKKKKRIIFDLTSYVKNVEITFSTDLDVCPSYVQSCFRTASDISALITDKNKNGKFYFNLEYFQM
jgi:hypothetical protein